MTIKEILYVTLGIVAALFIQGCSTQKHVSQQTKTNKQEKVTVQHITQAEPDFSSAEVTKMRFSLKYSDRQMSANGTLKFIKDSVLSVSLQPVLGIELFRLDVTPSKVVVVDKMNRRYTQFNYSELSKYVGLSVCFADIQAMAMQHVFAFSKGDNWQQCAYTLDKTETQQRLSFTEGDIAYLFLLDITNNLLQESQLTSNKMNASVVVRYLNESQTDNVLFPETVEVEYTHPSQQAALTMTMLRRQFNGAVNYSAMNLSSYKLVDISTILP